MFLARFFDPATSALVAAQRGDAQAFAKVYRTLQPQVLGFLARRVRHPEVARDLCAHVFMRAVEKIETYDASSGSARTWIFTLARSTWIDHLRHAKVRPHHHIVEPYDESPEAMPSQWQASALQPLDEWIAVQEDSADVLLAWAKLLPDEQEIVLLRMGDELDHNAIAAILNIAPAAARKRYARALTRLREELANVQHGKAVAMQTTPQKVQPSPALANRSGI